MYFDQFFQLHVVCIDFETKKTYWNFVFYQKMTILAQF